MGSNRNEANNITLILQLTLFCTSDFGKFQPIYPIVRNIALYNLQLVGAIFQSYVQISTGVE